MAAAAAAGSVMLKAKRAIVGVRFVRERRRAVAVLFVVVVFGVGAVGWRSVLR